MKKKEAVTAPEKTSFLDNLSPHKIFVLAASLSILLISFAAVYYFVIALPTIQAQKIEFEKDKFETDKTFEDQRRLSEEAQKTKAKTDLDLCISSALRNYHDNWARDCKLHKDNMEESYQKCVDSRNTSYNSCKASGLTEEYCKSIWLDDRDSSCKSQFEYKEDENGSCLLSSAKAKANEDYLSEQKDECYRKYELIN